MMRTIAILFCLAIGLLEPAAAVAESGQDTSSSAEAAASASTTAYMCPPNNWYPPIAVRLNEEGTTVLGFTITADGTVEDISIITSSGYNVLDQAAILCAQHWHYKPATRNGVPIQVSSRASVVWKLEDANLPVLTYLSSAWLCALVPSPNATDLANVTGITLLHLDIENGAIAKLSIVQSSGSTVLDQRALGCFTSVSADIVHQIVGGHTQDVPVTWKLAK